ncbi:hypothetical protein BD413DRAFT_599707 [Trametes elegans]|nr:hypothetical protein BD413DRAFT_599707 [Trametes elegans]
MKRARLWTSTSPSGDAAARPRKGHALVHITTLLLRSIYAALSHMHNVVGMPLPIVPEASHPLLSRFSDTAAADGSGLQADNNPDITSSNT